MHKQMQHVKATHSMSSIFSTRWVAILEKHQQSEVNYRSVDTTGVCVKTTGVC